MEILSLRIHISHSQKTHGSRKVTESKHKLRKQDTVSWHYLNCLLKETYYFIFYAFLFHLTLDQQKFLLHVE